MKNVGLASPIISAKLATVLLKQGKHKAVLRVVAKAIKLDPNHVLLHLYRAKSMIVMGDYEAAKKELIWVVRINPFDTEVHELLAKVLGKLGKRSEAESARRNARLVNGS
ncbi:MAG TPA: tetratricopeptide repeat protein [Myxococcales bacterium]|nr:tetratricopeptide repeat protein [Myxococcales bacterium]